MARTRVITRTVIDTVYEVMTLNTKTCEVEIKQLSLGAVKFPTLEKALLKLKSVYDTDEVKIANINSTFEREQIYGMLETDFMMFARPMDSERHFIEDDIEDTEEFEPLDGFEPDEADFTFNDVEPEVKLQKSKK